MFHLSEEMEMVPTFKVFCNIIIPSVWKKIPGKQSVREEVNLKLCFGFLKHRSQGKIGKVSLYNKGMGRIWIRASEVDASLVSVMDVPACQTFKIMPAAGQ